MSDAQGMHMPGPLPLEAELGPKKRRGKAKIFDAPGPLKAFKLCEDSMDAPGPPKAFKLCEDGTDAPGPLNAFKLCEDSTVVPGPTKRLKLLSTDDSGRAPV